MHHAVQVNFTITMTANLLCDEAGIPIWNLSQEGKYLAKPNILSELKGLLDRK